MDILNFILPIKYSTCLFFILGEDFAVVQQEIIMMKDCKHPNIVAYFGSYLRYIVCLPFEKGDMILLPNTFNKIKLALIHDL